VTEDLIELHAEQDLPKRWIWIKLEDIAYIMDVNHKMPKSTENGVPFVSPKDFKNNTEIDFNNAKVISVKDFETLSRKCKPQKGDILYSRIGTIGKVRLVPQKEFGISYSLALVRPINDSIDVKLLYYLLQSAIVLNQAMNKRRSIGVPDLGLNDMKNFVIPLIPQNEQHRVVSKIEELFTKLDAGVDALKKTRIQLRNYRRSILKYAFDGKLTQRWRESYKDEISIADTLKKINTISREKGKEENQNSPNTKLYNLPSGFTWTNIGNIQTFIGSGITPRGGKSVYVKEGIPFIRSQNVYPDGLRLADIAYVTPELHKTMSRTHVEHGDVLLNITGASIGRSAHIPDNFKEANVNQHVCIIRTGPWIIPKYLSYWLNSPFAQDVILKTNVGVTRQGLNYVQIRSLPIPFTSIEDQRKIVEEIELQISVVNYAEKIVKGGLRQSERLRQSILKAAFKGKLVPQDPNDEPASILLERMKEEKAKRGIMQKVNENNKNKIHTKLMRLV
jgi:type I restriction enzyme S subunit